MAKGIPTQVDASTGGAVAPSALFFGTAGAFSVAPLEALLGDGVDVRAVVLPAMGGRSPGTAPVRTRAPGVLGARELPMLAPSRSRTVADVARERGIEVLEVGDLRHPEALAALATLHADVGCVACFPRRLPPEVLALPRHGFVNVHPSLLPAYRGPAPLFWALRDGERRVGVSVHRMTLELDAGDVLEQGSLEPPDGIGGRELDLACSELGARLLVRAVRGLSAGRAFGIAQDSSRISYHGWPRAEDFEAPTTWSARRAYNFIRGVSDWPRACVIRVDEERLPVEAALSFEAERALAEPWVREGPELLVRFTPGVLRVAGVGAAIVSTP